ncbi:hypothetical protein OZ410_06600 [Robiginitalea sp. M366]|uniref:tetratricopeptide repeat protein n=1 Tax=Robiginitalea aestuariiviva TaxID=3036903 RepID=UPI00240E08E0|nr:hypothetical protein [Robiginitalea aestuariiviva]MDG1571979.1 hypothetical protein [Robiginitalea aestuariiviva]
MRTIRMIPVLLIGAWGLAQHPAGLNEEAWFDTLVEAYQAGDYWTALLGFERFADTYPGSDLAARAWYNRACLLREVGKPDQAIAAFTRIMNSDFDELEAYGGIMEQYALYKNRSAKNLAELYLEAGDYQQAGKYIYQFDREYPYQHFCGNELTADAIYTATMYARYYHGTGKHEKAIRKLLPYAFGNGLAGNHTVQELLIEYLPETFDRKTVQQELQAALESFTAQSKSNGTLKMFGVKIPVSEYAFYDTPATISAGTAELSWTAKLEVLLREHPVFGRYLTP